MSMDSKEGHMKESIRNQKVDDSFHVRSKEEDLYDYVRIEDIDAIDQAAGVKREKTDRGGRAGELYANRFKRHG